jgi:aryl sulfotransferase
MSRIIWLASYPKSGNTWLRAFLSNFERNSDTPADIDDLDTAKISSDRRVADNALGVECSDLTPNEIDRWRPAVYRNLAEQSQNTVYLKTHDAYTFNSEAEPLFPSDVTSAAVYLVRNPLDVAVSYAHHGMSALDESIELMSRETQALAGWDDRLSFQLRQRLLSWSGHVVSWLDQKAIRLHVMRYEDMCRQPEEEFAGAVRFLGLEQNCERVRRAVAFSSFETLRRQELEHGFKEKPRGAASFFRSGRVGSWREVLTKEQVERLIRDHGAVMNRLGYLPESGCIE